MWNPIIGAIVRENRVFIQNVTLEILISRALIKEEALVLRMTFSRTVYVAMKIDKAMMELTEATAK